MRKLLLWLVVSVFACVVPSRVLGMELIKDAVQILEENLDDGSHVGFGVMIDESPYRGVDDRIYPVPVLICESHRFFVDSTVAGYYLNDKTHSVRWAVIGSLRSQGYTAGDSGYLEGMHDRDWAFDGGLRVCWNNSLIDMTLDGVADVSGTHEGQELRLTVSKEFFDGFLTPRAGISWQSADLVDYYYGVMPSEVRVGRAAYTADDDVACVVGITVGVPWGEKWALFGDIQCSFPGDEVKDSPVVGQDTLMRYVTGVVYRF